MKKLIFMSVLALAMMTACQDETSNVEEIQALKIEKAAKSAENFVKLQMQKSESRGDIETDPATPTDAVIDCHTDWLDLWGSACIWSKGFLFKVKWETVGIIDGNNVRFDKVYTTTQVSFCTC